MITARITGGKQITKRLNALEPKVRNKIIRKATRAAARPIASAVKRRAPVLSGMLKKSVKIRALKRSRKAKGIRVMTGKIAFQGDEFYGGFVEFGHHIGRRGVANRRFVGGVHFMEEAFDARRRLSQKILRLKTVQLIAEETKRK